MRLDSVIFLASFANSCFFFSILDTSKMPHPPPQMLQLLLSTTADRNAPDVDGNTPLMLAAKANAVAAVELLLQCGCEANRSNRVGETALTIATSRGFENIVQLIEEHLGFQQREVCGKGRGERGICFSFLQLLAARSVFIS